MSETQTTPLRKTSFGSMSCLLVENETPVIEHLVFQVSGRPHRHNDYEYFVVLKGDGLVHRGADVVHVQSGDIVEIPPKALHWMEPGPNSVLEGFLWYQKTPLQLTR